jgi:predicted nucleic acid-binding Zn ribbon protein
MAAAARAAEASTRDVSTREAPARRTDESGPDRPEGDQEDDPEPVLYDPPELDTAEDRFELARRTVNRSRAAARDRGLFPISAKTQARGIRDRSSSSPGYSGARPDPRDPQGVNGVLRRVLAELGWNEGMNAGRVLEEWDQIVGVQVATHCRPVSLDEGILVISASSSAWASQMRMLGPRLITTIEDHVGAHVVSELRVTGPATAQRTWKKGRRTVTWRGPRDTYG